LQPGGPASECVRLAQQQQHRHSVGRMAARRNIQARAPSIMLGGRSLHLRPLAAIAPFETRAAHLA